MCQSWRVDIPPTTTTTSVSGPCLAGHHSGRKTQQRSSLKRFERLEGGGGGGGDTELVSQRGGRGGVTVKTIRHAIAVAVPRLWGKMAFFIACHLYLSASAKPPPPSLPLRAVSVVSPATVPSPGFSVCHPERQRRAAVLHLSLGL